MTEEKAIAIICKNIKATKVENALDMAIGALAKISVIKEILNECYEGKITEREANWRIKNLLA